MLVLSLASASPSAPVAARQAGGPGCGYDGGARGAAAARPGLHQGHAGEEGAACRQAHVALPKGLGLGLTFILP